jgi:putative holliday junction resolvase
MPIIAFDTLITCRPANTGLLGLDVGTKTVGLALTDPQLLLASPLPVLKRGKMAADIAALEKIIKERNVGALIIGLPLNMDGSEGPRAQSVRQFARNLLKIWQNTGSDIPIAFWDERLSTAAIERAMLDDDMTRARRDKYIDSAAAAWFLQTAMERLKSSI